MARYIYGKFYGTPLDTIKFYMIVLIFLWQVLGYGIKEKLNKHFWWKAINIFIVFGMLGIIGVVTLSSRSGSGQEIILKPFRFLQEARTQPELYRSMLMNVFLFFPLGLTLPYALPEKWNRKALISILFAMVLSIGIEFTQYYFHLGRAETDDVICNTLGCAIGTLSFCIANRKKKEQTHETT